MERARGFPAWKGFPFCAREIRVAVASPFQIGRSPSHTQLGVLEPGFRQVRVLRNPHSSRHKPEQCVVQGAGCDSDEHVAHLGYPKLLELRVAFRGGTAGPIV